VDIEISICIMQQNSYICVHLHAILKMSRRTFINSGKQGLVDLSRKAGLNF